MRNADVRFVCVFVVRLSVVCLQFPVFRSYVTSIIIRLISMDLQSILIIAGTVTILGVCVHGIYVSRKSSKPQKHWSKDDDLSAPTINLDASDTPIDQSSEDTRDFDDFGLGKARTVATSTTANTTTVNNLSEPMVQQSVNVGGDATAVSSDTNESGSDAMLLSNQDIPSVIELNDVASTAQDYQQEDTDTSAPLYASVVSNPKPQTKPVFNSDNAVAEKADEPANPRTANQVKAEEELGYTIPELPAEFKATVTTENLAPDNIVSNTVTENENSPTSETVSEIAKPEEEPHIQAPEVPQYLTPEQVAAAEAAQRAAEEEAQKPSIAQAAMNLVTGRKKRTVRKREPVVDTNQIGIDFDSIDPVINEAKAMADTQHGRTEPQVKNDIEPEFLAISLKVPKENPISGAQLLPALITLGMKYGENNIFHRHVNNNGKGPIVFSLANLFKPGVFDVDNMEKESIRGLSLFMTLPTESDAHQVFNMMHNAARKLAEEFNAEILDDNRSTLTKQGLQQYVERIRDFERRRLLG